MVSGRKGYTKEFREQSVRLTETSEKSIAQLAKELGVGISTLAKWKSKLLTDSKRKARATSNLTEAEMEVIRLKRELQRSREEVEILKKAMAYFAADQNRGSGL